MNAELAREFETTLEGEASHPLVEAKGVSVVFEKQQVLVDINLSIDRGQTVAIIGESGCGKTVFMKTLVGLIKPTSGTVSFDGRILNEMNQWFAI